MALQRMYPKATHSCSWSKAHGYGTHTAAGSWTFVESDCAAYVADLYGALDESGYGAARSMGTGLGINNGQFEWIFGDPPQNITISSLTLVGWFRTSSGNTAAIDTPPTIKFFVNPSGTRYYDATADTIDRPVNRNTQAPTGTFAMWTETWTTNPATSAAWTRADLVSGTFKAGLASDGTYGSGIYETSGGSTASFDVASFYVELDTTPTGLYIGPVRQAISHQLRMLRRALRTFTVEVPPEFCALEPGDTVWSSHNLLPWSPGLLSWQQVPLYLLSLEDNLAQRRRRLTFLDLRDQFASFWSPFQVTGLDAQNSGLAMIHRGGGWSTTRAQVAYGQRPGDGLYQQVASGYPLLTKDGLLIQGGSDKNYLLNSTFSQGTGDTFTSWTKNTSGSATITQDTADYIIDVSGFQRSAKMTTTASGENCYLSQTVSTLAANTKLHVRAWYKNDSGADAYFIEVQRSVDNYYWTGSTWQAAVYDLRPTLSTTIARYTTPQIDVGGSITNITVRMGHYSTVATGANVGHIYSIELQGFTDTGSSIIHWFRRDLLPTTTVAVTREKDETTVGNSPDFRVWSADCGHARVDVTPLVSHSDMADSTAFGVLHLLYHASAPPSGIFGLYYTRTNSMTGAWTFASGFGNATWTTAATGDPTIPVAGTTYTIAVRWTSTAEDEHGMTGQALDIWVNGVKGTGATGLPQPTLAVDDKITLGNDPKTTLTTPLDGYLTNLAIDSRCPTDDEMGRM